MTVIFNMVAMVATVEINAVSAMIKNNCNSYNGYISDNECGFNCCYFEIFCNG
jgi:hypothetical protein